MRWLYHLLPRAASSPADYAPPSLARDGFIHASFRDAVLESARLHFPADADLVALRIDPRRLDVPLVLADTPRGPMPHVHGRIPADAICAVHELSELAGAPDRVTGTRFAFVGFDGMTLLDLVGVLDPISRIGSMGFDRTATFSIVSAAGPRLWAGAGATLSLDGVNAVEGVRPPLDRYDVLVIPGGYGTRALEQDRAVIDWIAAYPPNRLLASVCTGALLLGAAGRLRGLRATTHHLEARRLADFGATAVPERVVDAGQVITAGGVTCGIDLGIHLVRRLEGEDVAAAIARQMELPAELASSGWASTSP